MPPYGLPIRGWLIGSVILPESGQANQTLSLRNFKLALKQSFNMARPEDTEPGTKVFHIDWRVKKADLEKKTSNT